MVYERSVRPALLRIAHGDAEAAHGWTLRRLATLSRRPHALALLRRRLAVPAPREVFGLRFPNPVGLAAGMDKDGLALAAWPALGFGFVEVGTVTWHAQPGNERPRVFRLPHSQAIINRMGFNNRGARALAERLDALVATGAPLGGPVGGPLARPLGVPLGISLGKSKITPLDEAVGDYLASLRALYAYGDYFAINVSSPNTPGLRSLQDGAHLDDLLAALRREVDGLAARSEAVHDTQGADPASAGRGAGVLAGDDGTTSARQAKPILVKIAPDLTDAAIVQLLGVCLDRGVAGVIATNTTLERTGLAPHERELATQAGGLSGRPLTRRARDVVSFVDRETGGRLPIIGVGGILEPDDGVRLVDAGASLVQIYTGLIYRGPGLVRATAEALRG